MFTMLLVFLVVHTSLSEVYDLTADDLFESILGDVHEYHKKIDPPKKFSEVRATLDKHLAKSVAISKNVKIINETHIKMRVFKPTTERETVITTTTKQPPNVTTEDLKLRMRKLQLNQMLETHTSSIPDFKNDADNPAHITRRFRRIVKELRTTKAKPDMRTIYFSKEDPVRLRKEKFMAIALMEQFIYSARYKMPYIQLLRKKYNYHLKYKIGYCFALLRHLKQQQNLIYASLKLYYNHFTNLLIHLKLYEKVVRLDVDIKDVCFLIRRMNYLAKIDQDPTYYDDAIDTRSTFIYSTTARNETSMDL